MEQPGARVGEDHPYTILCVCTGNICRSPVAERLLAARLGPGVRVGSAGVWPMKGEPIASPMADLLDRVDVASGAFAARALTRPVLKSADLILTATREHRATAVELWPATVRRAFTLKEFARLLGAVDRGLLTQPRLGDRLRVAVDLAGRERGFTPQSMSDDVADPYGRSTDDYQAAFDEIAAGVEQIATVVGPGDRLNDDWALPELGGSHR